MIVKEGYSTNIPIVGVIDSNIKTYLYHLPIIANDDNIESITFILSILSNKLLLLKYKKVIL
jgi:ribosomal protein S2